jgi:hypothetical protein
LSDLFSILPRNVLPSTVQADANFSTIELKPWWPLQIIPVFAALFAIGSLLILPWSIVWVMILSLPIIFLSIYSWQRLPAASISAISAIQWHDNSWRLCINQQWYHAALSDEVIWADWVFLQFTLSNQSSLFILPIGLPLHRQHFHSESDWRLLRRHLYQTNT